MPSSTLILPDTVKPLNLMLASDARATAMTGDLYNICNRIRDEVSERLRVVELERQSDGTHAYAIMEECDDGEVRLVYKVKSGELDGRVIERLQYMLHVPFHERLRAAELENEKWEADFQEAQTERMYEKVGEPMYRLLESCGFNNGRPVSYAKAGHVGGRGSNRRERRAAEKRQRRAA